MRGQGRAEARRRRMRGAGSIPAARAREQPPQPARFSGTAARTAALLGEDRTLRDFARSPYDPTYAIGLAAQITRGTVEVASRGRIGALVMMVLTAGAAAIGLVLTIRSTAVRDGAWVANALWSGLFTFMFGAFALALARRYRSSRHPA